MSSTDGTAAAATSNLNDGSKLNVAALRVKVGGNVEVKVDARLEETLNRSVPLWRGISADQADVRISDERRHGEEGAVVMLPVTGR